MSIENNPKEIFKVEKKSQEFLISILATLIFPLLSLIIEYFINDPHSIGIKSLLLGSSIYAASIAFITHRKIIFILSFILSFLLAILYGISFSNTSPSGSNNSQAEYDKTFTPNKQDSITINYNNKPINSIDNKVNSILLPRRANVLAFVVVIFLFFQQILERYNRHILLQEEFLIFK